MRSAVKPFLILALICSLVALGQHESRAQFYFGKNKIQYTDFQWRVMKTDHFEVYFYAQEAELAEVAVAMAERAYGDLSARFHQSLTKPIPLILYSAHNYFQQTNTIPYLLPEGVGGFMEFYKGRVVLPFDGSYARLEHVIRHELVHVFTLAKIRTVLRDHEKFQYHMPPLWMIEGLAEYWSTDWDARAEMIMRDAVISGHLVPLEQMYRINGTFQMYKEGQSALAFICEQYGEDKILSLFENWWKEKKFSRVLERTLGEPLEEVDRRWRYSLKKRYYPLMEDLDMPRQIARRLTFEGSNVKPAVCDPGLFGREAVVFMSDRMGYQAVYLLTSTGDDGQERRLIRGERSSEFESLHLLRSKLDVSGEGLLALISKSQETDVLHIWDLESERIVRTFQFPGLIALSSPSWAPDGDRLAFSGADQRGYVDLYVVETENGRLQPLTDDLYDDREPDWSPDGRSIVFSSDRSSWGRDGFRNLYLYHLGQDRIQPVTEGRHNDYAPSWSPDGRRIAFSSDREDVFNLYVQEIAGTRSEARRITNILTGAFDPVWMADGRRLIFSAFSERRFQLFCLEVPDSLITAPPVLASPAQSPDSLSSDPPALAFRDGHLWTPEKLSAEQAPALARYRKRLSLDIAQSAISYDPVFGVGGGFQMALTDMLGDHQYYFLINNTASDRRDFLSSFNFGFSYFNLSGRTNYGGGAFHFVDDYYDDYYGWYYERQYGGFITLSHPFSKYHRAETSTLVKNSDKENYDSGKSRSTILASHYLSLIKDTSLWGPVGPLDGSRMKLSLGLTWEPRTGRIFNRALMADLRHYFRLSRRVCHAVRVSGRISQGLEPQIFYMGGSWDMRGYDRRHFMGRKMLLVNNELRLPVIDNLLIGFPFGNLELQAIRGALFFDLGQAWNENLPLRDELLGLQGSFGMGLRARVGYFTVLRLDFAKLTDFNTIFPQTKIKFWFGWNY
jgi:hypothetical protein